MFLVTTNLFIELAIKLNNKRNTQKPKNMSKTATYQSLENFLFFSG